MQQLVFSGVSVLELDPSGFGHQLQHPQNGHTDFRPWAQERLKFALEYNVAMENPPFTDDFPIETIAMFDYRRVLQLDPWSI